MYWSILELFDIDILGEFWRENENGVLIFGRFENWWVGPTGRRRREGWHRGSSAGESVLRIRVLGGSHGYMLKIPGLQLLLANNNFGPCTIEYWQTLSNIPSTNFYAFQHFFCCQLLAFSITKWWNYIARIDRSKLNHN